MRQLNLSVSCRVHSTRRRLKAVAMTTSGKAGWLAGTSSFSIVFPLSLSCKSIKHPVCLVACQCSKEEREEHFLYTWQPSKVLSSFLVFPLHLLEVRGGECSLIRFFLVALRAGGWPCCWWYSGHRMELHSGSCRLPTQHSLSYFHFLTEPD